MAAMWSRESRSLKSKKCWLDACQGRVSGGCLNDENGYHCENLYRSNKKGFPFFRPWTLAVGGKHQICRIIKGSRTALLNPFWMCCAYSDLAKAALYAQTDLPRHVWYHSRREMEGLVDLSVKSKKNARAGPCNCAACAHCEIYDL